MFEASKEVILHLFRDRFKTRTVRPGIISIIHFTGRDMKYNPHIHMLVTEGGLTERGFWRRHAYWPYEKMCEYWKYEILKRFRFHCRDSLKIKGILDQQWRRRFQNQTNGYVVKNYRDVRDVKKLGRYLARYVRHPPIGESRILSFDGETVEVKYEWDNKMHIVFLSLDRFIRAILLNIPSKGFQAVRYFGLYSNKLYRWAASILREDICPVSSIIVEKGSQLKGVIAKEIVCPKCLGAMEPVYVEYLHNGVEKVFYF